ncbi:hypothetical protein MMC30_000434 [Trapelia coarctata]|nr:hypothetical protein [Trapelia coarctata]
MQTISGGNPQIPVSSPKAPIPASLSARPQDHHRAGRPSGGGPRRLPPGSPPEEEAGKRQRAAKAALPQGRTIERPGNHGRAPEIDPGSSPQHPNVHHGRSDITMPSPITSLSLFSLPPSPNADSIRQSFVLVGAVRVPNASEGILG